MNSQAPEWLQRAVKKYSSIGYEGPDDELRRKAEVRQAVLFNTISALQEEAASFIETFGHISELLGPRFFHFLREVIPNLPNDATQLTTTNMQTLIDGLDECRRSYKAAAERPDGIEFFETLDGTRRNVLPALWKAYDATTAEPYADDTICDVASDVEDAGDSDRASLSSSDDDDVAPSSSCSPPLPIIPSLEKPRPTAPPAPEEPLAFPTLLPREYMAHEGDATTPVQQISLPGSTPWPGFESSKSRLACLHRPFRLVVEGESPEIPFEVTFVPDDRDLLPMMYRVADQVHGNNNQVLREHLKMARSAGTYRERTTKEIKLGLYPPELHQLLEEDEILRNIQDSKKPTQEKEVDTSEIIEDSEADEEIELHPSPRARPKGLRQPRFIEKKKTVPRPEPKTVFPTGASAKVASDAPPLIPVAGDAGDPIGSPTPAEQGFRSTSNASQTSLSEPSSQPSQPLGPTILQTKKRKRDDADDEGEHSSRSSKKRNGLFNRAVGAVGQLIHGKAS